MYFNKKDMMDDRLDNLFSFPIIMIDGDVEDQKREIAKNRAMEEDFQVEIIEGTAECPYYDFLSISDHWLPTKESYALALMGKFEACFVKFSNSGSYLVPWPKNFFKKKYKMFVDSLPAGDNEIGLKAIQLDKDLLIDFLQGNKEEKEEDDE